MAFEIRIIIIIFFLLFFRFGKNDELERSVNVNVLREQ